MQNIEKINSSELKSLNYLEMFIKETLRLYGAAYVLEIRYAIKDIKIGDY